MARMSEEVAAIEDSTVRAAEDRKKAAELLVMISRQVCYAALACMLHVLTLFAVGSTNGR